jgi:hypothetical protein
MFVRLKLLVSIRWTAPFSVLPGPVTSAKARSSTENPKVLKVVEVDPTTTISMPDEYDTIVLQCSGCGVAPEEITRPEPGAEQSPLSLTPFRAADVVVFSIRTELPMK